MCFKGWAWIFFFSFSPTDNLSSQRVDSLWEQKVPLECWDECIKHVKLHSDIWWNQSTSFRLVTSVSVTQLCNVWDDASCLWEARWNSIISVLGLILILHVFMKVQKCGPLTEGNTGIKARCEHILVSLGKSDIN